MIAPPDSRGCRFGIVLIHAVARCDSELLSGQARIRSALRSFGQDIKEGMNKFT